MPITKKEAASRSAFVALLRAHERLQGEFAALFKTHGLTLAQFNVLRILRGAGGSLPCQVIAERLINRLPDVTRLVDRMEKSGLVTRERGAEDRRVVLVKLSRDGRRRVDALDEPVAELHGEQAGALSMRELEDLRALLEKLRARD